MRAEDVTTEPVEGITISRETRPSGSGRTMFHMLRPPGRKRPFLAPSVKVCERRGILPGEGTDEWFELPPFHVGPPQLHPNVERFPGVMARPFFYPNGEFCLWLTTDTAAKWLGLRRTVSAAVPVTPPRRG